MNKTLLSLVLLTLLGAGCQASTPSPTSTSTNTPSKASTTATQTLTNVPPAPTNSDSDIPPSFVLPTGQVQYVGSIDRNLPIHMTLWFDGTDIRGEYSYDKVKKPITLTGIAIGDKITLDEHVASEDVNAIFNATYDTEGVLQGTWTSPDGKRELRFIAQEVSNSKSSSYDGHYVKGKQYIDLYKLPNGKLKFQAHTEAKVAGQSALAIGEQSGIATINEFDGFVFKNELDADSDEGCELKMSLIPGGVALADNSQCSDPGVHFDGEYQKASTSIPNWDIYAELGYYNE